MRNAKKRDNFFTKCLRDRQTEHKKGQVERKTEKRKNKRQR